MNDAAIVERWLAKYRTILESGERPEPLAVFLYAGRERSKAKYEWINFVRPDGYHPYTIEQRFGVLRWLVSSAQKYSRYGLPGPIELLSRQPTCINCGTIKPINSAADLDQRFHFALLSRFASPLAQCWRHDLRVQIGEHRVIAFPHYEPFAGGVLQGRNVSEDGIERALRELLDSSGNLTVQLNSCYAAARDIYGVRIHVYPDRFLFRLSYGFDGSVWPYTLAATENNEPFLHTLDRALTEIARLRGEGDTNTATAPHV